MCFKYYYFVEKLLILNSIFIANQTYKFNVLLNAIMFSILGIYFVNEL